MSFKTVQIITSEHPARCAKLHQAAGYPANAQRNEFSLKKPEACNALRKRLALNVS